MNFINPFDKEGKKGMDLVDRTAIAILFLFFLGITLYMVIAIAGIFKKSK